MLNFLILEGAEIEAEIMSDDGEKIVNPLHRAIKHQWIEGMFFIVHKC